MRANVPSNLSGGSLLDAHKWVKSQMARTNPGGSADYTLRSIDGGSVTLSDLVKGNPAQRIEVEIVMAGHGGVRSNPRGYALPTDFASSPSSPRPGNFTSALLPSRLDPQLVERMVAQEGLFGAVQTLTILLSERSPMESISPTTAGLLYAHSAIPRKNPSVKTPFLSDVPKEMIDSDIRIMRYLDDQGINLERAEGIVNSTKVNAKYGLTRKQLETFVDDVLAPFMAIAPANRGALRHINKRMVSIKSTKKLDKNYSGSYAKLMQLMPTKAEDFYHGREFGLIAGPQCIYPMLVDKILPPKAIVELLEVASKYPDNLVKLDNRRMGLKLSKKQSKLITHNTTSPSWKERFYNILTPNNNTMSASFTAKLDLLKDLKKDDEQYVSLIVDAINSPGLVDTAGPKTQGFIFVSGIGGFFPSPPNKWPQQVVYAVMDTFLESLPEIVDIENPQNNYESKVYKALHSPQDSLESVYIGDKPVLKATLDIALATATNATKNGLVDDLMAEFKFGPTVETALKAGTPDFLAFILENCITKKKAFIDPKYGKSSFELLFDVVETAKGKYGYDLVDDDLTFAMILIDFSIKQLFDDGTAADAGNQTSVSLGGLIGSKNVSKFTKQAKHIFKTAPVASKAETAVVIHLGALAAFVDGLRAETLDGITKKANMDKLDAYIKVYGRKPHHPSIKALGLGILNDGKVKLQGIIV